MHARALGAEKDTSDPTAAMARPKAVPLAITHYPFPLDTGPRAFCACLMGATLPILISCPCAACSTLVPLVDAIVRFPMRYPIEFPPLCFLDLAAAETDTRHATRSVALVSFSPWAICNGVQEELHPRRGTIPTWAFDTTSELPARGSTRLATPEDDSRGEGSDGWRRRGCETLMRVIEDGAASEHEAYQAASSRWLCKCGAALWLG